MNAKDKLIKEQQGQSILEIIVAVAIGTILISALVALSVRANRGADFSRIENQASKLAAEGMEILKNIKAANGQGIFYGAACDGTGSFYSWIRFFSNPPGDIVETGSCSDPVLGRKAVLFRSPNSNPFGWDTTHCNETSEPWCLDISNNNDESITVDNRLFTRSVYISDSPTTSKCNTVVGDWNKIKQISVKVSWTDSSGTHETIVTSCLQR